MEEIIKYVQDLGLWAVLLIILLFLGLKYLPKYIEMKLNRAKEKDYMMDSFKAVIENNSKVIDNNSEVIRINSSTIKNYTDNAHKLEENVKELTDKVQIVNQNIEILKERK